MRAFGIRDRDFYLTRYLSRQTGLVHDHGVQPVFWAAPSGPSTRLSFTPRLASWDAAASASQVALKRYLDAALDAMDGQLTSGAEPLALRLDVGLPAEVDLIADRDLDNYLFPLVGRLQQRSPTPVSCVWATKEHGEHSTIRLEPLRRPASPEGLPRLPVETLLLRTTASAQTTGYKQQIRDQVVAQRGTRPLPAGPVHLELAFVVGGSRNWLNLWKPTIDALDPLLGPDPSGKAWHPLDGRITSLGLHCQTDPTAGHDVTIAVLAEPVTLRNERHRDFAPVVKQVRAAGGTTEHALAEIRRQGGHMMDAVTALRAVDRTDLGVLKQLLDESPAWADHRESNHRLRQAIIDELEREDDLHD